MHVGTVLERHGGIVHGRGTGAQHGHGTPAQPFEVDDLAGVARRSAGRARTKSASTIRRAVLAGGQHQLARRQHLAGRQRRQQAASAIVEPARHDAMAATPLRTGSASTRRYHCK